MLEMCGVAPSCYLLTASKILQFRCQEIVQDLHKMPWIQWHLSSSKNYGIITPLPDIAAHIVTFSEWRSFLCLCWGIVSTPVMAVLFVNVVIEVPRPKTLPRLRTERTGILRTDCFTIFTFSSVLDEIDSSDLTDFFELTYLFSEKNKLESESKFAEKKAELPSWNVQNSCAHICKVFS